MYSSVMQTMDDTQRSKKVKFKQDRLREDELMYKIGGYHCQFYYLLIILSLLSCLPCQANAISYRSRIKRDSPNEEIEEAPFPDRSDTVCNQGSPHECICNRSMGDLDDKFLLCDRVIEEKRLTIVSLIMRNINFDVKLHTNEPYQQYFRRRIANIVSQYCENQANQCPGVILSLNRNNVIILRLNYMQKQRIEVQFVVAKESMPKKLNNATLLDSEKVKNILATKLGPLSRVLGGVNIEKLRVVELDRRKASAENKTLLKLLIVVGVSMAFCYTIACAKVCRDTWKKRKAKKDNMMLNQKKARNYGSCTDKLLSCEVPNGKSKSKNSTGRLSANSSTKGRSITQSSRRSNNNNEDLTSLTIDINQQNISQPESSPQSGATDTRSFQRMFACDLSQLPAENSDFLDEDGMFYEEGERMESTNYNEINEVENPYPNNTTNRPPLPIVPIVIASGSQFSIDKETSQVEVSTINTRPEYMHQDSNDSIGLNQYFQTTKSPLLSAILEVNSLQRPLSRRGSRDSTPEQGEEFADNLSTDSLQPLGDKGESPQNKNMSNKNPEITFEQSSSEDENDEPYHQLQEDVDVKEKLKSVPFKTNSDEHYSSEDEERSDEHRMLDRHAYERLEESPAPLSPPMYTNNNSLPQVPIKSNQEDAFDLAEQTSDYEDLR